MKVTLFDGTFLNNAWEFQLFWKLEFLHARHALKDELVQENFNYITQVYSNYSKVYSYLCKKWTPVQVFEKVHFSTGTYRKMLLCRHPGSNSDIILQYKQLQFLA